jgi:hypothetical protein
MVLLAAGSGLYGDGLSLEGLIGVLGDGPLEVLVRLGLRLGRYLVRGLRLPETGEW